MATPGLTHNYNVLRSSTGIPKEKAAVQKGWKDTCSLLIRSVGIFKLLFQLDIPLSLQVSSLAEVQVGGINCTNNHMVQ